MTYDAIMSYLRTNYSRLNLGEISKEINVDEDILRRAIMQEPDAKGRPVILPEYGGPHLLRIIELMQQHDSQGLKA